LTILARKIFSGEIRSRHRTEKGASLEFDDYRKYAAGDDLRYVDWNVYQRLDQLVVKEYQAERDLVLTIVLDSSGSMALGEPQKARHAIRMAAAVGYIGLHLFEQVNLVHLPFEPGSRIRGFRSKGQIFEFFTDLERQPVEGQSDLAGSLKHLLARHSGRGRAVLISDFAAPLGAQAPLRYLAVKRLPADLLHVVAPEERQPTIEGPVMMTDPETGERQQLTIGRVMRERYEQAFRDQASALRAAALRSQLTYLQARTEAPFEETLRALLETGELLR